MTRTLMLALCGVAFAFLISPAGAPPPPPPSHDAMAWDVFIALTTPASTPRVKAVAFETWASDDNIYTAKPYWPRHGGSKILRRSLAAQAENVAAHVSDPPGCAPQKPKVGHFPAGACIGEEVQHNRPVFDFIVNNNLYSKAGRAASFHDGKTITFPGDSIVVKADWVKVSDVLRWLPGVYKSKDEVRRAYYTNMASFNGQNDEYALAGMSVQSKQLPDWLWMTFEHRSNPGRCDLIGCHDDFGAAVADVPGGKLNTDYGPCAKSSILARMFAARQIDAVWNNYCLKGTQTTFTTDDGAPTILANSVIERMNKGVNVKQTSCITCHAYAAYDSTGAGDWRILPSHPIGAFDASKIKNDKAHDYLWGILKPN